MNFKQRVLQFDTVESTMTEALKAAREGAAEGTTVVAKAQTAGRGRRGREWHSPSGGGLFATTIVYPEATREKVHQLSLVTGVAIHKALEKLGVQGALLKWPNDILVGPKKLCGILLECVELKADHVPGGNVVLIGYGLNLKKSENAALPEELNSLYVGLGDLGGEAKDSDECIEAILEELEAGVQDWNSNGLEATLSYWGKTDALAGKNVEAQSAQGAISGTALGLDEDGRLILKNGDTTHVIDSGEVFEVR